MRLSLRASPCSLCVPGDFDWRAVPEASVDHIFSWGAVGTTALTGGGAGTGRTGSEAGVTWGFSPGARAVTALVKAGVSAGGDGARIQSAPLWPKWTAASPWFCGHCHFGCGCESGAEGLESQSSFSLVWMSRWLNRDRTRARGSEKGALCKPGVLSIAMAVATRARCRSEAGEAGVRTWGRLRAMRGQDW